MRVPTFATVALLPLAAVLLAFVPAQSSGVVETKIESPDWAVVDSSFGSPVAMDGETIAIGDLGYFYDWDLDKEIFVQDYVWVLPRPNWNAVKLEVPPPEDYFGFTLAVDGDFIGVGSESKLRIYARHGHGWSEVAAFPLGWIHALAMNGGRLAVVSNDATQGGLRVHVMRRVSADGTLWETEATLMLSGALALWNDTLVVGSAAEAPHGAVHVFERSEPAPGLVSWDEVVKLAPDDLSSSGLYGARFGSAVALRGDRLLVGAPDDDPRETGSAYAYRRSEGVTNEWLLEQKLRPRPAQPRARFGASVAIGKDQLFVGAKWADVRDQEAAGAVNRFLRSGPLAAPWQAQPRLTASDFASLGYFGSSLASDGERLVVGAPGRIHEVWSVLGWAYLYRFE